MHHLKQPKNLKQQEQQEQQENYHLGPSLQMTEESQGHGNGARVTQL
jgi:hypothetical protein